MDTILIIANSGNLHLIYFLDTKHVMSHSSISYIWAFWGVIWQICTGMTGMIDVYQTIEIFLFMGC